MSNPRISIVSHTYGRSKHLQDMIASVRATTPPDAYEVLVVSSDPPETEKVAWLQQQEDVILILADVRREWELRKNSAYHYINLGIKQSHHEWVVVFNDDMCADKNWYQEFATLVTDPKNANVGMIIGSTQLGKFKYGQRILKIGEVKKVGQDWKDIFNADLAIIRRDVLEKIGCYDEKMDWAGGGADLALAVEFLTDTETITSEKIKIDHFIAAENRGKNIINEFNDFHYVKNKWNKWCQTTGNQYKWEPKIKPYTPLNRLVNYLLVKARRSRVYLRYFRGFYNN